MMPAVSGRSSGVAREKTRMETIITTNRKLVPQRGCRRVILRAFSTCQWGRLSLVAADGLMLRAVIEEDAAPILHAGHEEHVSKEDHDAQQALEQVAHRSHSW